MQISAFLNELRLNNTMMALATDPTTQFGTKTRRYIGAELLPERPVSVNDFIEQKIKYRTLVANAGTRYSPAQKKGGSFVGSFPVHLGEQDIASELTSVEYDALIRYLRGAGQFNGPLIQSQPGMQAVAQITNWLDTTVVRSLVELLEVYRWQAIVNKSVTLTGDNGLNDTVAYPNYPELSSAAGGNWSDNAYDPFTDIFNKVLAMGNRGVSPARIIMGRQALTKLLGNALVRTRVGRAVMGPTGQVKGTIGLASIAEVNAALEADGLPPIEVYDLMYQTEVGAKFFLQRDACVIVGATGRSETIDLGNAQFETIENTLGYTAIGVPAGQSVPGRHVRAVAMEDKPPRIEAEGWQTALPVITEPEGFAVITGIA